MTFRERYNHQILWLMEGEPSIRFQTLRDLLDAPEEECEKERQDILLTGWGKTLLDLQDPEGTWAGSLYSPKWISTFYTLFLLKRLGASPVPRLLKAAEILLNRGFYEPDGGINYWKSWKQGESCVTGMLLSMLCYFGVEDDRIPRMADYLLDVQMDDGGWNCEKPNGAVHSSFHTTISVLEGLREYDRRTSGGDRVVSTKQEEGIEFLLKHRLYKSSTTGEVVHPDMAKLSFPPRWHYDILRCLDYCQDNKVPFDRRMEDAVALLKSKMTKEGFWKLEKRYTGKIYFQLEKGGVPSRWNTLRALRILRWLDEVSPQD